VRDALQVKLVEQDGELSILARSGARRDKEQAMRRRLKNWSSGCMSCVSKS
jgi:hypothetical protein